MVHVRLGVAVIVRINNVLRRVKHALWRRRELTCVNALPRATDQIATAISQTKTGGQPMRAMDVMTGNVVTVTPETSVQDLAKLLSQHGISGVPVVDAANRLVGIVSEGDL